MSKFSILLVPALLLFMSWPSSAADLGLIQVIGDISSLEGNGSGNVVAQKINCLIAAGASLVVDGKANPPVQTGQVTFYGRSSCGRPLPYTRGAGAVDLKLGFLPVDVTGQARLVAVGGSADGTVVATAPVNSDYKDADGAWSVSQANYSRPQANGAQVYKVIYDVLMGVGYYGYWDDLTRTAWITDPPGACTMGGISNATGTNVEEAFILDHGTLGAYPLSCHLESAPFMLR